MLIVFGLLPTVTNALLAQRGAQTPSPSEARSTIVPFTLDHNRIVIDVDLPLPDGSTAHIRGWVDNGSSELRLSRRVATLLGLNVACGEQECSAPSPREIVIGGMTISLAAVKEVKVPLKPASAAAVVFRGMSAEITIPSSVLRSYDVLIDFPDHKLTLAQPGTLKFNGVKAKVLVNAENGLIQVPSQIEKKKYNLALDLGSSISFLSGELFDKLATDHPEWPRMTGAIGPANMRGSEDELKSKLMRLGRVQYGPLFLTNIPVVRFSSDATVSFEKRTGIPTAGLLGTEALLNYRVGIDYAHSAVYFDIGRLFNFPDFDLIGLILRPEDDGRFTVLGIADYEGNPSVPADESGVHSGDSLIAVDGIPVAGSTLGQVWSMLGGLPGKERRLTIERGGKQFTIAARVQHFLGEADEGDTSKGKSHKN